MRRSALLLGPVVALLLSACGSGNSIVADLSLPDADCVADPAACGLCATDEHCKDPANPRCETTTHKCVARAPEGAACKSGTECQSRSCVNGACSASGR